MSCFGNLLLITLFTKVFCNLPFLYDTWAPGEQSYHGVHNGAEHAKVFFNEWTVHIEGSEEVAQLLALELGYVYGGRVIGFPNTYTFLKYEHSKQRRTPSEHTSVLNKDRRIIWAEQLFTKHRTKRYVTPEPDAVVHRVKRLDAVDKIISSFKISAINMRKPWFNDELWRHEWYLQDTRTINYLPRLDLNVLPVYAMGFNGSGVRVSVLDDGIEHNHTDLRLNYDPEISWDCNDRDADPMPRYDERNRNSHGTRCAGEIAMTANNVKCGVGVAWGAKVGGVRMLDGRITDRIEGEAIGYAWEKVDIYSASWGPNDDGRTVEGPGRLAVEALKRGVTKGRGGKGIIYVWANGNGGGNQDNCNCDGYSSSIYTISIGSASQHGMFPWYGEICTSTLATAYSSGAYSDQKIATTDTGDRCTLGHTGTSAAAPLAAGIIALALQANPSLTWRDIQHLIVWTSEYSPLSANAGWEENGVGLRFDVRFGFGLLNAGALVAAAFNWTNVPENYSCRVKTPPNKLFECGSSVMETQVTCSVPVAYTPGVNRKLSSMRSVNINIGVGNDCKVKFLEHVELVVNLEYTQRGALEIHLTSPLGTSVQLLSPRPKDLSTSGFVNWPLMSVATWGESPEGIWKVTIEDKSNKSNIGEAGAMTLVIHGSSEMPAHMISGPRRYNNYYDYTYPFDFFDIPDDLKNPVADDKLASVVLGQPNIGEGVLNEVDSTILSEVDKELQRVYHRKIFQYYF